MIDGLVTLVAAGWFFFRSRANAPLEVLALRQQLAVLKRKRLRPELSRADRAFWVVLRRLWPRWSDALVIVKPELSPSDYQVRGSARRYSFADLGSCDRTRNWSPPHSRWRTPAPVLPCLWPSPRRVDQRRPHLHQLGPYTNLQQIRLRLFTPVPDGP